MLQCMFTVQPTAEIHRRITNRVNQFYTTFKSPTILYSVHYTEYIQYNPLLYCTVYTIQNIYSIVYKVNVLLKPKLRRPIQSHRDHARRSVVWCVGHQSRLKERFKSFSAPFLIKKSSNWDHYEQSKIRCPSICW